MNLHKVLREFQERLKNGSISLYNEFGLQFELAIFLRNHIALSGYKIELERPIGFFGIKEKLYKKEIDIAIYNGKDKYALELKYPTNGQVPLQMFKFCEDLGFLEQLTRHGFYKGYSLVLANHDGFWKTKKAVNSIYKYFRGEQPNQITGDIECPTGKDRGRIAHIDSTYSIKWEPIDKANRMYLLEV
jgi:hypothetical protein